MDIKHGRSQQQVKLPLYHQIQTPYKCRNSKQKTFHFEPEGISVNAEYSEQFELWLVKCLHDHLHSSEA